MDTFLGSTFIFDIKKYEVKIGLDHLSKFLSLAQNISF